MNIIREDDGLVIVQLRKSPEISFSWAWDDPYKAHLWLGFVWFPYHFNLNSAHETISVVRHDRLRMELSESGEEVARELIRRRNQTPPSDEEVNDLFGGGCGPVK